MGYKQLMELLSDANEYLDNRRPGGVTCMPLGHCSCIYGTEAEHFQYYGFVGPTESNCLTQDGLVLCIDAANPCVGPPNPPEPEPVQPVQHYVDPYATHVSCQLEIHVNKHALFVQEQTDYEFVYSVKAPYHGDDHSHQV